MSLVTLLAEMLKSGKVTVSTNDVQALEIKAENKKIDVNALDKQIIKDTLNATRRQESKGVMASLRGTVNQIKNAQNRLGMLKQSAEELQEAGITITLSYRGNLVATMGQDANAKISSAVTGTKAIEINSTRRLIELII